MGAYYKITNPANELEIANRQDGDNFNKLE